MNVTEYIYDQPWEKLVLEPDNWSVKEWETICAVFSTNNKEISRANRIIVTEYIVEVFENDISDEEWKKAINYLNMLIVEYASLGFAGSFGLNGVLVPLKKRFDKGERTKELYDAIMECE